MSKPTLILTPGAWHVPAHFEPLTTLLSSPPHNYRTIPLHLPSVAFPTPTSLAVTSLEPDIATIRAACEAEFAAGHDVVVMAHSWSGLPVSSALVGMGKKAREARGEKNGVVAIAYVAAFLVPEGVSLMGAIGGTQPEWWDVKDDITTVNAPEKIFYNDLTPEVGAHLASLLQPHAFATIKAESTGAAWREIPSSYLLTEADVGIPIGAQEGMVQGAQDAGAGMYTERCKAGHSPFVSMPEVVSRFVRRAAGEVVE